MSKVCLLLLLAVLGCVAALQGPNPLNLIPTPYGRHPAACVHTIPDGAVIKEEEGQTIAVNPLTGEHHVFTSCPHTKKAIRNARQSLERHQRKATKGLTPKAPFQYDGWLAYTTAHDGSTSFDSFLGYFSVPNDPQNYPEVLYIFTGLQNNDWIPIVDPEPPVFDIIQPVLQYPSDEGSGWSLKSWYVTLGNDVLTSSELAVASGANVFGNMTQTGEDTWFVSAVRPDGHSTSLTVTRQRLASQPWAYNTIECYGCGDCSYLPTNTCDFTKLELTKDGKAFTPTWVPHQTPTPRCHTTAHVTNPTTVSFSFQQQQEEGQQ